MDLNMRTESERQEAVHGFNGGVKTYDNKPDYPEELINIIISKVNLTAGSKLLEIGSGTGRATVQFADLGFEIVCIEPGINMIERAKTKLKDKSIEFIASRFEDYAEPPEYFDAVISAQAWHWVSQPIGFEKCANTLKKGGYLAPFWNLNLFCLDVDLDRELWAIIDKYSGQVSCMPEENYPPRMESITSNIAGSGLFSKPEVMHFYKENNFTADGYYTYMSGGSGLDITDAEKQACQEELTQLAEKYNGIKRNFHYELYLTQKI
ncbi:MAG: methyltransferase domain-containing protein [Oscillospiraceae bacterium]|nr:methyltransferase domain-containing protein [Oscillospiraceae bacterium]